MNWNRAIKISGFIGAAVCGACLTKTFAKSSDIIGSVSAVTPTEREKENSRLKGLTLKQVHVYFRHGARTPIHIIPGLEEVTYSQDLMLRTPPHLNFQHKVMFLPDFKVRDCSDYEVHYKKTPLKGGAYAGNLTTYGQEQMYSLGLRLRRTYVDVHHFLTDGYRPQDVFVQSTNIDRTIASARCVMVGLFGKDDLNKNGEDCVKREVI